MKNSSKYYEIMDKLRKDGKVTILNSKEDIEAMNELNRRVEVTKEECKNDEAHSEVEALNFIVR